MRYTGPRNRIARRENMDLGMKTPGSKSHARLLKKLNVKPGQHGTRTRRKISDHAKQLREKQKLRYMFGVTEGQLKKYFNKSIKKKGNTALYLAEYLERRLDNIVYRIGLAPTRAAARQLVTHGHITVGGQTVSTPSYQVGVGETVGIEKAKTLKIPFVEKILANKDLLAPAWIEKKASLGKLTAKPETSEIEKQINLQSVIEFYSR